MSLKSTIVAFEVVNQYLLDQDCKNILTGWMSKVFVCRSSCFR